LSDVADAIARACGPRIARWLLLRERIGGEDIPTSERLGAIIGAHRFTECGP
jgi:hypothetical protein